VAVSGHPRTRGSSGSPAGARRQAARRRCELTPLIRRTTRTSMPMQARDQIARSVCCAQQGARTLHGRKQRACTNWAGHRPRQTLGRALSPAVKGTRDARTRAVPLSALLAAAAAGATGAATQMTMRQMPALPAQGARRVKRPACRAPSSRSPACWCGAGGHPQRTRLLAPQQQAARAAALHAGSVSPDVTATTHQLRCMARLLRPVPPPWRTGPLARSAAQATHPPPHPSSSDDMKGQRREHACRLPTAADGCISSTPSEPGRPRQSFAHVHAPDGARRTPQGHTSGSAAGGPERAAALRHRRRRRGARFSRPRKQVVCGNEAHVERRQARGDARHAAGRAPHEDRGRARSQAPLTRGSGAPAGQRRRQRPQRSAAAQASDNSSSRACGAVRAAV